MTDTLNQEMSRTERRRFILRGLMRALILSLILILLYFLGPLDRIDAVPVWVILVVAPLILLAVSVWQIRAILRSDQPGLRGIEALSIIAPLYLILFAAAYFLMARADPASFTVEELTRIDTLYFTDHGLLHGRFRRHQPGVRAGARRRHDPDDPEPRRARCRREAPDGGRATRACVEGCGCGRSRRFLNESACPGFQQGAVGAQPDVSTQTGDRALYNRPQAQNGESHVHHCAPMESPRRLGPRSAAPPASPSTSTPTPPRCGDC